MKKIDTYQALWGMEQLPTPEAPYTIEEQLRMIQEAGFDGALNFIDDISSESLGESYRTSDLINESNLKLGLSCNGFGLEDIKGKIDYSSKVKAEFLNIMVKDYYIYGEDAIKLLKEIISYGKTQGVKVYIETHRGTVTQDLIRATEYVEAIADMALTIDLSHYVVGCEIGETNDKIEAHFDQLLRRTNSIHIRISNGEQVQLPLNRIGEEQLQNFLRWWQKGINYWSENARQDEVLPIVVELGPQDYQQKVVVDGEWVFDCDRWNEALIWKSIISEFEVSL